MLSKKQKRALGRKYDLIPEELISRRSKFIQEMLLMSEKEDEFPPLAFPSLAASDVTFLVNTFYGTKSIISFAMVSEANGTSSFGNDDSPIHKLS